MNREEQIKTLREIIDIEKYLVKAEKKLFKKKFETYSAPPEPPVCKTIVRTYPTVTSNLKFNRYIAFVPVIIALILAFGFGLIGAGFILYWPLIYYFVIFKKQKQADEEQIRNSEEYKSECIRLDNLYNAQQEEENQKYAIAKQKYDTETLPNYNNQLNAWNIKHDLELENAKNDIMNHKKKLASIYDTTRIVPLQYRTIEALQYIYDMISTSNYDVTYAINSYDTHRQRMLDAERMRIEEARLQEQQLANDLADEQAQLMYEQNLIAERARKDARIASTVSAVQHHNTNKILKDMSQRRR